MNSKGWKSLALAAVAAISLSACQKSKKEDKNASGFKGLWINLEAKQELTRFSNTGDARICQVVLSHGDHFGVSVDWDNTISLDAWSIGSNGDVYRYSSTPYANSAGTGYRDPSYMGRVSNAGDFLHTNSSLGLALVPPSSRGGSGSCYQPPFARGNANVQLNGPVLMVWHPGFPYQRYVKVTDKRELNKLSQALSVCGDIAARVRARCGLAPAPQYLPDSAAPAPGHFRRRGQSIPVPPPIEEN